MERVKKKGGGGGGDGDGGGSSSNFRVMTWCSQRLKHTVSQKAEVT
jgi:hypothetical protein